MKETIQLQLIKPARSVGGDRYEADIGKPGKPKIWVVYVDQKFSRVDDVPVGTLSMTIAHGADL
jgi:hypothetical protein